MLIEKGNTFVDTIDTKEKYLKKRRYKTKAKLNIYLSIRVPEFDFGRLHEIYKNFPVLEAGKKINLKEIDVDIEDDKAVEVDVEFAVGSEVNVADYDAYAKKISAEINKSIKSTIGDEFKLIKLEIDTSGIRNDKKIYRY